MPCLCTTRDWPFLNGPISRQLYACTSSCMQDRTTWISARANRIRGTASSGRLPLFHNLQIQNNASWKAIANHLVSWGNIISEFIRCCSTSGIPAEKGRIGVLQHQPYSAKPIKRIDKLTLHLQLRKRRQMFWQLSYNLVGPRAALASPFHHP